MFGIAVHVHLRLMHILKIILFEIFIDDSVIACDKIIGTSETVQQIIIIKMQHMKLYFANFFF